MKKLKKSLSLLLSLLLALTMALPVMAAGNNTLTITSKTGGHIYQAYQVFAGDYFNGTLSNVTWGSGVDGDTLLAALQTDPTVGMYFTGCTDAKSVAKKLTDGNAFGNDSATLDAVADVIGEHLTSTFEESGTPTESSESGSTVYNYTMIGLEEGYYFVKDKDDSITADAYTKFMLQVVGNTTVAAKAEVPEIDKTIDLDNDENPTTTGKSDYTHASVGDKIPFIVTSKVPAMDGYEKYYFMVTDTMSDGLTFNNDVAVSIGGTNLTAGSDYTVETNGQTFTVTFVNFIQYKAQAGAEIKITYSATLNEKADIGTTGNKNSVTLTYSNNPNIEETGNPGDKPGLNSPVGETPSSDTYTFSTGVKLKKVDEDGNVLTGAKFQIKGDRVNIVLVNSVIFQKSDTGTYYLLKNGTYTQDVPTDDTASNYDSTTVKYEKVDTVDINTEKTNIQTEGYVNEQGILTFNGLSAGTYEITELVAPDGYNKLKDPITFNISWDQPTTPEGTCSWRLNGEQIPVANGIIELTVENESGTQLPSTGGIGTTLFYVIGGIMMAGAAVLLITRRRMKDSEE